MHFPYRTNRRVEAETNSFAQPVKPVTLRSLRGSQGRRGVSSLSILSIENTHDASAWGNSLSVPPERWPVPPDWVLGLRVGSASTWQVTPPCLIPGYRARRDLPGRGPSTPLVSADLGPRYVPDKTPAGAIYRNPQCCFPQVGTESAPCKMSLRRSIARPTDTPITLRAKPLGFAREIQCGQDGVAFSFLVGLFRPLQHAGLSRRTPTKPRRSIPA